jgi:CPA1 family monovalent cation:H+ antiporter
VLIVTRLACTLGTSALMTFLARVAPSLPLSDPHPGWRGPVVFGWTGMRGVVSLAAALSIPVLLRAGEPFPQRNLILFITFVVILVTLVFQGLTLPWLMRVVQFHDDPAIPEYKQELIIQKKLALASLRYLQEHCGSERAQNERLDNLFSRLELDLEVYERELAQPDAHCRETLKEYQAMSLEMLQKQREMLNAMNQRHEFDEGLIRKYLGLVDVEELSLREGSLSQTESV